MTRILTDDHVKQLALQIHTFLHYGTGFSTLLHIVCGEPTAMSGDDYAAIKQEFTRMLIESGWLGSSTVEVITKGGSSTFTKLPPGIGGYIVDMDNWDGHECPRCGLEWEYEGAPGETCPTCKFNPETLE